MKDNITNAIISKYVKQTEDLITQFYKVYFLENYDDTIYSDSWYMIWGYDHWPWTVEMDDYYFQVSDMFIALNEKIEKDILFKWYDYQLDFFTENKEWNATNLRTFNKVWGDLRILTK